MYFGILLLLFWRSEKNAFWFILVYFMLDPPGGLFPPDINYGLPFIKGLNLRFMELFTYVAFFKALKQKSRFNSMFYKPYQLLLLLTILLILYTLFLNTSVLSIIITLKWLFVWSLIYSISKLIYTYDEWLFLFRMAFIIVFIGFLSQLLHLALGHQPAYLLGTNFSPLMDYGDVVLDYMNPDEYNLKAARPVSCISIMQLALVGAMFFLQYKKEQFPKVYLYLVIILSYLSILLTATRGWFIAFSVVIFLYFALIQKIKRIAAIIILAVVLIPLLLEVPIIKKQFQGSFKRLSTIESISKGDLSAGGTNARDEYSRDLINLWKESPLLGWGFTDIFKKYGNGHAGLANLLFSVGILGYIIFIYFWYKLFFTPILANYRISVLSPYKGSLVVFSLAFLIFFILHSTSGQQFGIDLGFGPGIFSQTLYYCYSSFFIIKALNNNNDMKLFLND